jgi:YidC/Oxa1 family membrane protein insertase
LAANLAVPDYVLLALYVVSMYFSIRLTSPAIDPQQAQQQKIMAFISPVMIGYFGFKYAWPSALILYWLSFNVFTMAQQYYLINKYHRNPSAVGPHPEGTPALAAGQSASGAALAATANGTSSPANTGKGGSRASRRRRSSRR